MTSSPAEYDIEQQLEIYLQTQYTNTLNTLSKLNAILTAHSQSTESTTIPLGKVIQNILISNRNASNSTSTQLYQDTTQLCKDLIQSFSALSFIEPSYISTHVQSDHNLYEFIIDTCTALMLSGYGFEDNQLQSQITICIAIASTILSKFITQHSSSNKKPSDHRIHIQNALIHRAVNAFELGIQQNSKDEPRMWLRFGEFCATIGQVENAMKMFETCIQLYKADKNLSKNSIEFATVYDASFHLASAFKSLIDKQNSEFNPNPNGELTFDQIPDSIEFQRSLDRYCSTTRLFHSKRYEIACQWVQSDWRLLPFLYETSKGNTNQEEIHAYLISHPFLITRALIYRQFQTTVTPKDKQHARNQNETALSFIHSVQSIVSMDEKSERKFFFPNEAWIEEEEEMALYQSVRRCGQKWLRSCVEKEVGSAERVVSLKENVKVDDKMLKKFGLASNSRCRSMQDCVRIPERTQVLIADKLKVRGNDEYYAGDYYSALDWYSRARRVLIPWLCLNESREIPSDIRTTLVSVLLNMAAVYLKLELYAFAVEECTIILHELDKYNTKALFRRALAFNGLELHVKAQKDLLNARSILTEKKSDNADEIASILDEIESQIVSIRIESSTQS